jgi:hypothetical protein
MDRDIVEWIVTILHPLRRSETETQAGVEMAIKLLREQDSQSFPRVDSIKKATGKLREALGPCIDLQMPFWDGDQPMTIRDALDFFEGLEGPSSKVDVLKRRVANQADCLVFGFSQEQPTTTVDGKVSDVASLLYQALTGEKDVRLKRQIDAVRRSWRESGIDESKNRGR